MVLRRKRQKSASSLKQVEDKLNSAVVVYGFYAINCGINDHAFTLNQIVDILVNRASREHVGGSNAS